MKRDVSLDNLLELHGTVLVIDDAGYWVKFSVVEVTPTTALPHGLDYELTLHDPKNTRIAGFDNAHPVSGRSGPGRARKGNDHKHRFKTVTAYDYRDAEALLVDFWGLGRVGDERTRSLEMTKTLTIGISNYADMKARTLRIARGELKSRPSDPKVWFPSLESLAKVLSESNRELLALIEERRPSSLRELSDLSGRAPSNLSRTLQTMSKYGLVELERRPGQRVAPKVQYSHFKLEMPIASSAEAARATIADHEGRPH